MNVWWDMYDIRPQVMNFTLTVSTNTSLATDSQRNNTVKSLTLSGLRSAAVANDSTVSARILGNLTSYLPFPDFTGFRAMAKRPANGFSFGVNDVLIMFENMTTLLSNTCDILGSWFTGFTYASPVSDGLSMHHYLLKTQTHASLLA
jgi:hypothetical protein